MNVHVFDLIKAEQPKLPGWASMEKALTLASLVISLRPAVTVEIGIYGGSSMLPILLAHKSIGHGLVYGIEPWSREEAIKVQTTPADIEWWRNQDYEHLKGNFLETIKRLNCDEPFRLIQKPSRLVDPMPGIGLLHIDGGHDNQAINDVVRFAQQMLVGGVAILDDLQWAGGAVTRAAQRLEQMGFKLLYPLGTGACYQRVR